jgi:hypothetical protein
MTQLPEFARRYWSRLSATRRVLLVVVAVIVILWLRSYWAWDFYDPSEHETFMSTSGRLIWKHRSAPGADFVTMTGPGAGLVVLGTGALRIPTRNGQHMWEFETRYWLLALLAAVAPSVAIYRLWNLDQRQSRIERGLCAECGYDLRDGPDRCPECGAVWATQASA